MNATYRVQGMTCGGCARNVTRALERLSPALRISVSVEQQTAEIHGDHSEEAVKEVVEKAGFAFHGRLD